MSEVCSKVQDGTHFSPKNQTRSGTYRYITAKNIKEWGIDLADVTYVDEGTHRHIYVRCNPERGDVLYIKDGATTGIATVNQLDEEFSLLSSVALLKPHRQVMAAEFLKWYLNSPAGYKAMTDQMTGSAITRLVLRTIRGSPVPVPPLSEQKRIIAMLEKLLARVDAARARLDCVPAILKRFRQAVLAAACSGRLTEEWRSSQGPGEDAATLTARVHREAGRRYDETCARVRASGARRPKAPPSASMVREAIDGPHSLPDGWNWYPAGAFYHDACYGTSMKCSPDDAEATPVLRVPNIVTGRIDLSDLKYGRLSEAELCKLRLRPGDVLVCRTNGSLDLVGKAAVAAVYRRDHALASYLIRGSSQVSVIGIRFSHRLGIS
jgi:type I restriction enzyme S subunit